MFLYIFLLFDIERRLRYVLSIIKLVVRLV